MALQLSPTLPVLLFGIWQLVEIFVKPILTLKHLLMFTDLLVAQQ
jgi:hypothetical protein